MSKLKQVRTGSVIKVPTQNAGQRIGDNSVATVNIQDKAVTEAKIADGVLNKRNHIINGNFDFWQRGTVANNIPAFAPTYLADRFFAYDGFGGTLNYTRSTDVPNKESLYSAQLTVATSAAIGAGEIVVIRQSVEGGNFKPISGKTFTVSFYVKSSVTGTYSVSFRNVDFNRCYIAEYVIDSANTWEKKSITLTHDETGTWNYDTGVGISVDWVLSSGSSTNTTPGTWQSGNFTGSNNQVDWSANPGATFQLSQVMLNEGAVAAPFQTAGANAQDELAMCQRYYEKSYDIALNPGFIATSGSFLAIVRTIFIPTYSTVSYKVNKRTTSNSIAVYNTNNGTVGQATERNIAGTFVANRTIGVFDSGNGAFNIGLDGTWTIGNQVQFQWVCDSEL